MTRNQEIEKAKEKICPVPKGGRSYEAAIWCSGFDFGAGWADRNQNITGKTSDGYHSFDELYEYRLLYNAAFFNELAKNKKIEILKSLKHSDGEVPFGGGWFIVMAELPTGQISNHYELKDWDLFRIPEREVANVFDGHTPQMVVKRIKQFILNN